MTPAARRIFIVAGEESGDRLGASLMDALIKRASGPLSFHGVGGRGMAARGLVSLFPMEDLALHGLLQVVPHLPRVFARGRQVARAVGEVNPHVVVLIDSPGFNMPVARSVRRAHPDIPVIDYVPPMVWGYAPWRARRMRPNVDQVLTLLPFEPDAVERLGGPPARYVGHPVLTDVVRLRPAPGERAPLDVDGPRRLLVLPGSRRSEIDRLLPVFGATVALIGEGVERLEVVLPTLPYLLEAVEREVARWAIQPRIVTADEDKYAAFRSAHAALAASGTVSVELALAGVPMAIAYRLDPLMRLAKPFLYRQSSIVLANLIIGENIVPEFVDRRASPATLADAVVALLNDTPERRAQLATLENFPERLSAGEGDPSDLAAAEVLAWVEGGRQRRLESGT